MDSIVGFKYNRSIQYTQTFVQSRIWVVYYPNQAYEHYSTILSSSIHPYIYPYSRKGNNTNQQGKSPTPPRQFEQQDLGLTVASYIGYNSASIVTLLLTIQSYYIPNKKVSLDCPSSTKRKRKTKFETQPYFCLLLFI